jgi:hypothetical protein
MLLTSGLGPAHVISVDFATPVNYELLKSLHLICCARSRTTAAIRMAVKATLASASSRATSSMWPQRSWDTLARTATIRRDGADNLLKHVIGKVLKGKRGKDLPVETTTGELMAAHASDAFLRMEVKNPTRLLERDCLPRRPRNLRQPTYRQRMAGRYCYPLRVIADQLPEARPNVGHSMAIVAQHQNAAGVFTPNPD